MGLWGLHGDRSGKDNLCVKGTTLEWVCEQKKHYGLQVTREDDSWRPVKVVPSAQIPQLRLECFQSFGSLSFRFLFSLFFAALFPLERVHETHIDMKLKHNKQGVICDKRYAAAKSWNET